MASLLVNGAETERAAEYRRRADDVLAHAAATSDAELRGSFLDIAKSYFALAEHIENRRERRATSSGKMAGAHQATTAPHHRGLH
jgi:hypothetical protein